jgi:hypothetical protein
MDEHGPQNQHLKTLGNHLVLGNEQYLPHHSANCDLSQRQICFSPAPKWIGIPKNTTALLPGSWTGPPVSPGRRKIPFQKSTPPGSKWVVPAAPVSNWGAIIPSHGNPAIAVPNLALCSAALRRRLIVSYAVSFQVAAVRITEG